MSRKICVVTGTRAEYGLLKGLLRELRNSADFELQLVATGMHLSPEFGLTYQEIENDGFTIDDKVEMLLSADTATGVSKSMGLALIGFSDVYARLAPDLLVVLGDRFEIFSAVTAAMIAGVPVAHLHGGETTEGAFDEAIRHSITKMAHLHFVAAEEYRLRVIQLGEHPDRVFLVGGLGIDAIQQIRLLDRAALEASLNFRLGDRNLLISFHPETLAAGGSANQLDSLLDCLDKLQGTHLIFTMPNADTGSREIAQKIEAFVASHDDARAYASLGQLRYLSCMNFVDGVIGNSSSGLMEAPTMCVGTVNIGDRQRGRLRAKSVIDCAPDSAAIHTAIERLYSAEFQAGLPAVENPYGDGGAVMRIIDELKKHSFDGLLKKSFHDL